jgi:DNA-binding response OmpR family regulator
MALRPRRILIVDGSVSLARSYRRVAEHHGYEVHQADESATTLDYARRCLPHLILLDVGSSALEGYRLLSLLKNEPELSDVPVLTYSAKHDRNRGLCLELGAVECVDKPSDASELMHRIEAFAMTRRRPGSGELELVVRKGH